MKHRSILAAALVALGLLTAAAPVRTATSGVVTDVPDGDTIVIDGRTRVTLAETGITRAECRSRAQAHLARLVEGKRVTVRGEWASSRTRQGEVWYAESGRETSANLSLYVAGLADGDPKGERHGDLRNRMVEANARRANATKACPKAAPKPATSGEWLSVRSYADGDSFTLSNGVEYRLYAANTPEHNECYGSAATARTKHLTRYGVRVVKDLGADKYGRRVAIIGLRDGSSLAINLGESGHANTKYTSTYRHQDPAESDRFTAAYNRAKRAGRGLHGACTSSSSGSTSSGSGGSSAAAPSSGSASCHRNYSPCVPIKGDGSGRGSANDLDCKDVRKKVRIHGADPYRLDGSDNDGWGCESYG